MKIERKELLAEMENLLKDEFVAEVTQSDEQIVLQFVNGQKFCVKIEEL